MTSKVFFSLLGLSFRAHPVGGLEISDLFSKRPPKDIASQPLHQKCALVVFSSCHCAIAMACISLANLDACVPPVWRTDHLHLIHQPQHRQLEHCPRSSTDARHGSCEPQQRPLEYFQPPIAYHSIGLPRLTACDTFPLPP